MKKLEKQIKKELSFVKECEQNNTKQLKELRRKPLQICLVVRFVVPYVMVPRNSI